MALKALPKIHLKETPLMKLNFLESLTLNIQETTSTRTRTSLAQLRLRGESSQTRGSPRRGNGKSTESTTGRTGRGADSVSRVGARPTITAACRTSADRP